MRRRHVSLLAAISAAAGHALAATEAGPVDHSPYVPPGCVLEWHDEFDEPIRPEDWLTIHRPPRRGGWLIHDRSAVQHADGHLLLMAFEQDREVLAGWITTQASYRRRHGYFETKVRLPTEVGLRAAAWLMSPVLGREFDRPDRSGAEAQLFSFLPAAPADRRLSQGVYWNPYEGTPYLSTNRSGLVQTLSNAPPQRWAGTMVEMPAGATNGDPCVFGLLWTERSYVFSVNGRPTFWTARGVSQVPQFLSIALLPPPRTPQRPIALELPMTVRVDYVRVYAPPP